MTSKAPTFDPLVASSGSGDDDALDGELDFGEFLRLVKIGENGGGLNFAMLIDAAEPTFLASQSGPFYVVLVVSFLVLVSTSAALLLFFKCQTFDPKMAGEPTQSYLRKDLSVDCNSPRYRNAVPFVVAMIAVYPLGIPAVYLALLWKVRRTLRDPARRQKEEDLGFPTVRIIWFWCCVRCVLR